MFGLTHGECDVFSGAIFGPVCTTDKAAAYVERPVQAVLAVRFYPVALECQVLQEDLVVLRHHVALGHRARHALPTM